MRFLAGMLFLVFVQAQCDHNPFIPGGSSELPTGGINAGEPAGSPIPEIGEPVSVRVISRSSVDARVRIRFLVSDYTVRESNLHIPAGVTARPIGPDLASFVGIEGEYVGGGPTPSMARILGQDYQGGDEIEYIIPEPFDEGSELRACCDDSTGNCLENILEEECLSWGTWLESGMTCADCPSSPLVGACCAMEGVSDSCELLAETACAEAEGRWLGAGSVCAGCPGPELRACCDYTTGACQETISEDECLSWGTWLEAGMTCADCPSVSGGGSGPTPPPPTCGPLADGSGCRSVSCPDARHDCVPVEIRVTHETSQVTVLACACIDTEVDCHVAYYQSSSVYVYCVGEAPEGATCDLVVTENDDGTTDYACAVMQMGACCDIYGDDGLCELLGESECHYWGGQWLGAGTSCADCPMPPVFVPCDFDHDCNVNANDLAIFEACRTGPAIPYHSNALPPGCTLIPDDQGIIAADFDRDGDVDQDDFALFQQCYSKARATAG
ncbi:MAG: hypothetical protein GXY44_00755 [Phycisphaerales bacterium]|nr:hypothetical protein [Phycisphaerales bacterium]